MIYIKLWYLLFVKLILNIFKNIGKDTHRKKLKKTISKFWQWS